MNETFYTTIENQVRTDGSYGLLYDHFDAPMTITNPDTGKTFEVSTYDRAQAKFFTVCAAACTSGLPFHEVYLLNSNSGFMRREVWDRRVAETTPEE